jgi:hypothetical protein
VLFLVAGLMELAAIEFGWFGIVLHIAAGYLVNIGIAACVAATGILLGVLSNAYSYKSCMDQQGQPGPGPVVLE